VGCGIFNGSSQCNRKVNQLENEFMNGENNDQLSVHYDLTKIDDSLSYFLSLAKQVNLENNETIQLLNEYHMQFKELETIEEYSKWYDQVKENYPIAIGLVKNEELSDQYKTMVARYEATLNSAIHTISYSSLNSKIREYEKETSGFLGNLIKTLTGVKGVGTFD
jgi:hypothetical protein